MPLGNIVIIINHRGMYYKKKIFNNYINVYRVIRIKYNIQVKPDNRKFRVITDNRSISMIRIINS